MSAIGCGLAVLVLGAAFHVHAVPSDRPALDAIDAARRATPVATYEGGEVTVGEVEDAVGIATPSSLEDMSRMSYVQHFYYETLRQELLFGEAQRRGYADMPAVQRRLKELAVDLMLGSVIAEPMKSYSPSEEALKEFFKTRSAELGAPELRRVVELVVPSEEEARTLLPRFQSAQGTELRELIKKHSLAPSRNEEGFSRYFDSAGVLDDKSSSVDSALAKATYALPPVVGATSNVFAMSGQERRFAVVKLLAIRPAYTPTYEQAVPVMKKILSDEERDRRRGQLEDGARATLQPEINDKLLELLPAELSAPESN